MGCSPSYRSALLPALRRLDGVRIVVGERGCQAEAYGIGHHLPATVRISLGFARRLADAGAPCEFRVSSPLERVTVA